MELAKGGKSRNGLIRTISTGSNTQRERDNFGRNEKLWKIIVSRALGWDTGDGMSGAGHASECEQ